MSKGHSPFSKTTRILAKLLIFGVILGSYTDASVFAAVGNNVSYTMEFSENTVENMPANILDGSSLDTQAIIPSGTANTPTRPGYKFAGWCDQPTTKSENDDTCASGHSYQPGETISLNQTGANNIKLYAIWTEEKTIANSTTMQEVTSCPDTIPLETVYTLTDPRDNQTYKVARLKDGKCWMLDNLALDLTTVSLNDLKGNTNASDEVLTYLKNGGGSGQYPANGVIAKTSNSGSWTNSYTDPYIATGYISTVPQGNNDPLKTETSNGNWKIGVYYNYCAASAGSYCYSTSNAPTDNQNGVRNIDADICPKGWQMPTGNTSGEYSALASEIYGSTGYTSDTTAYTNYRSALRLPLSDYFLSGSASNQGSIGLWWSSTRNSSGSMYRLLADTSNIDPALSSGRSTGYSVRCVLGS